MKHACTTIPTLALGLLLSIGPTAGADPEPDLAPTLASFTEGARSLDAAETSACAARVWTPEVFGRQNSSTGPTAAAWMS